MKINKVRVRKSWIIKSATKVREKKRKSRQESRQDVQKELEENKMHNDDLRMPV